MANKKSAGNKSSARSNGGSQNSSKSGSTKSASARSGSSAQSSSNARSANGSSASRSNGSSKKQEESGLMKLFTEQLQDIYYVEKQMLRSLGRMAKAAQSDELRTALEDHKEETENQKERLEEIFEMLDKSPKARKCEAMDGLLEEAKELMEDFADDAALDTALVAASQKVEHYEIATYGSLCAWAEQLGLEEALPLLEETLQEEKQADQSLTVLAISILNLQAEEGEERETASAGRSGSRSR